jgi:hypothetical protein
MTTVATTTTADDPRQAVISATAKRLYDGEPP